MADPLVLKTLAQALVAGSPAPRQVSARVTQLFGNPRRWLPDFARRYAEAVQGRTRPRLSEVIGFLERDPARRYFGRLRVRQWLLPAPRMQPVEAARDWDIPVIVTPGDLAAWFSLSIEELEWFADLKGLNHGSASPRLHHYHYRVFSKPSGAVRLIEAPKHRLKQLQRRILVRMLDRIPGHPAVHGFRKDRSILTFAAPHTGHAMVLRMDLRDFFPSLTSGRIQTLFRTLGYPEPVADLLGGICTNVAPRAIWRQPDLHIEARELAAARTLYGRPHLPQGAPASPALANLCAYRADCRLAGLAKAAGAEYTRYADDLAFSGGEDFARCAGRFSAHAAAILLEEGFAVNHRKTRLMRDGVRQHLAGLTVNEKPNVSREQFDQLKAILTNCVRHGAESQNREGHPSFRAHLEGRVGFVEMIHPGKGRKLREILDRIEWPATGG